MQQSYSLYADVIGKQALVAMLETWGEEGYCHRQNYGPYVQFMYIAYSVNLRWVLVVTDKLHLYGNKY